MDSRTGHTGKMVRTIAVLVILLHLARNVIGEVQSDLCPYTCINQTCEDPYTDKLGCTHGCIAGYYGNKCYNTCPSTCKTCHREFGSPTIGRRECYACHDGFYLTASDKLCTCNDQCSGGCNTGCIGCSPGYYLDSTTCQQCPAECSECTSSTTCTACNSGYTLTNSRCTQCYTICSTCLPGGTCTACISDYYLDGTNCQQCPSSCKTCNSNNECTTCRTGFYMDNSQCLLCPSRCSKCLSETVCTKCNSVLHEPKAKCEKCVDGRYEPYCYQCPFQCLTCTSNSECQTCRQNYYNSDTVTNCALTAPPCPSNCDTCQSESVCTTCSSNYYLSNEQCLQCPTACSSECDSNTPCTSCNSGFYLSNSNCLQCGTGCRVCNSNSYCTECNTDYYLSSGQCQQCPTQCSSTCGSNTACTACNNGYYLSDSDCLQCGTGCRVCNSNSYCTECNTDYYLSSGQCQQCPTQCSSTCDSNTACTACNSGYYLENDGCHQCGTGCNVCDSNLYCRVCSSGYYLSNQRCLRCPSKCTKCTSDTNCTECSSSDYAGDMCEKCVDGKYLNGDWCSNCLNWCQTCIVWNVCQTCIEGRYNSNSVTDCSLTSPPCPANCETCHTGTECATCQEGFYMTDSSRDCTLPCPSVCKTCTDGDNCTSCEPNFHGDKCDNCIDGFWSTSCNSPCPNNCLNFRCYLSTGDCVECPPGYTGNDCESCKEGKHGNTCNLDCSPNCLSTTCARNDGHCDDGCINDNFNDGTCVSCKVGSHGAMCTESCPVNCLNNDCRQANGTCYKCVDGYAGGLCDQCFTGKYGVNCSLDCSRHCVNVACDRNDGVCSPCTIGYHGIKCDQACSSNCYGQTCNQTTGICSNGCETGYFGDKCCVQIVNCETCSADNECGVCTSGFYGSDCTRSCPENCDIHGCGKDDGICRGCNLHLYGDACQQNCSRNCVETEGTNRCQQQSGFCTGDCVTGYYGDVCNMTCGGNCNDNACNKAGTACLQSCKPGFTGHLCSEEKKDDPSLAPVIGGAAGGAVVLAIIVVVIVVLMKRRKNKNKEDDFPSRPATKPKPAVPTKPSTLRPLVSQELKAERRPYITEPDGPTDGDESDEEEKVEPVGDVIPDDRGDMYGNIGNIRKRIAVVELEQYVATTPRQDLITEYKVFPRGLIKTHDDSRKPENMGNNRYAQVYPYDENRVKLTGRSTDYVNASYINGHNKERAYIASLGPTLAAMEKHSLFWDMVWQKDVEKIVMVTNLVENTNMKVQQYWPEANGTMTYGNITVMNLHENVSAEYTVRNFSVSKGNQKRTVSQVHFTAWPDKGVPDHVTSIVEFHNRVKSLKHELNGPILVHCSAGIGRTGTYIALDILTEEGEATGHVDVYNCVMALRQQRVNMVQTESQYIYLHEAVAHNLTYDSRPIPAAEFQKVTADTSDKEFENKFERLKRTMEEITEEEDKSKRKSKTFTELNRNGTDIPAQRYRPLLYKYQAHGDNDYVNAVYINSFKTKNHFIAAQTPLPATVVDFIKLILQENCTCVVNLEPETLKTRSLGEYLPPDNQTVTHGQFQLSSTKLISPDAYTVRQVTIVEKDKKKAKEAVVHCFQFNAWPGRDNVPRDPATFLRFIKDVTDKAKEMTEDGDYPRPILIHCLSGAIKCGLFCAVHNAVEKMENEQEVSIENIMRQIKVRRRSALSNKDQLAFCYKSVCAYLDLYNTYSNFELRL